MSRAMNSRQVAFQNESLAQLTSTLTMSEPATRRKVTVR